MHTRRGGGAVLALAFLVLGASEAGAQRVKIGSRAPDIDLPTLTGGHMKLADLRGHPVVVSYWTTWCPSCRAEMAELMRVHGTHSAAGLRVLSVNGLDQEHARDKKRGMEYVRSFVERLSLPFEVALDGFGTVRQRYEILGLPTTVFIDSAGVVQEVHRGAIKGEELDRALLTILPPR